MKFGRFFHGGEALFFGEVNLSSSRSAHGMDSRVVAPTMDTGSMRHHTVYMMSRILYIF